MIHDVCVCVLLLQEGSWVHTQWWQPFEKGGASRLLRRVTWAFQPVMECGRAMPGHVYTYWTCSACQPGLWLGLVFFWIFLEVCSAGKRYDSHLSAYRAAALQQHLTMCYVQVFGASWSHG